MPPNVVCMFLVITRSAVLKNNYSIWFCFGFIPLWLIYKSFLVRSVTLSPYVQMTLNLIWMFIAKPQRAVLKNCKSTSFHFFFISLWLYKAFLVRSVTLSPYVQMPPNVVCMFLAMTRSAVHKNCNYILCRFYIIPLWFIFSEFLAKGITCCACLLQWNPITLNWVFLELFPIYKLCCHSQLIGYFICEFCAKHCCRLK